MIGDTAFYEILLMLLVEVKFTVKNGKKGRKQTVGQKGKEEGLEIKDRRK